MNGKYEGKFMVPLTRHNTFNTRVRESEAKNNCDNKL